jgi:deoxycytidine triphosphate deaminase
MLKSDRWTRKMAREHHMINPFSEKQAREGVISCGLSSQKGIVLPKAIIEQRERNVDDGLGALRLTTNS